MYLAGRLLKCCLWMAKQSALNSKSVIIIVNHGGHFWQCFNLTDTKGHICQMDAGKPQSPTFQNTSCHICESVYKTARWKKERRKKKIKLLLYAFTAFCSHHRYNFWLQNFKQRSILRANCRNLNALIHKILAVHLILANTNIVMMSVVRGHTEDLWAVPTQHEGFYTAFITIRDIGHLGIHFASPYTGSTGLAVAFLQRKCDQM